MTPIEWFLLTQLLLQQGPICIAREDRKFLAEMINLMTLDEDYDPLPWQRRWLLALKRECRL